jgi:hypothetical protein
MTDRKHSQAAFWWTSLIVTVASIIVGQLLQFIERNYLNKSAYHDTLYFTSVQSINFPLFLLVVTFISSLAIVWVYKMVYPMLPKFWMGQGVLIGFFLFFAADFPSALIAGYTTAIPAPAAQGITFMTLLSRVINGCILAYTYKKFTEEKTA